MTDQAYNSPAFVPLYVYLSVNVLNHASNVLKHVGNKLKHASNVLKHTNIGYYVKTC